MIEILLENNNIVGYGNDGILFVEMSVPDQFFPSIISSARGSFLISKQRHKNGSIRIGVFNPYGDVDKYIPSMCDKALQLSRNEKYENIFNTPIEAFDFIKSNLPEGQKPEKVLIPDSWNVRKINKFFGSSNLSKNNDKHIYLDCCEILKVPELKVPAFFSRPDYCGLIHTFENGFKSIILHNVSLGISFVTPK